MVPTAGTAVCRRTRVRPFAPPTHGEGACPQPFNSTPRVVNSISFGSPHVCTPHGGVLYVWCARRNLLTSNTHPGNATALSRAQDWERWCTSGARPFDIPSAPYRVYCNTGWQGYGHWLGTGNVPGHQHSLPFEQAAMAARVRAGSRSVSPPWGSIRFLFAPRTYAPCGPSVRAVSQAKSRKIPTRNTLPLSL